ncbi:uncharacterized protein DUF3151 [Kineococcus xinjiangensis]|uniref:Uncharacterized protein DUF3151 n=1 Tax=Kineococcus xinjiangensis TaxID=512762 RepID=A0A2S6IUU2_9ACTN|nr:DUF3151 domain-containing protein [Kineococcus xinjiangensis]PPK97923.1 uncharacterized protein DUF3151 [Kineococcus xinjiangensis]
MAHPPHGNLLPTPPTHLPADPAVTDALAAGTDPEEVAAAHPAASLAWALLAERALADGETITAYAFARTGYHRGLDALRRSGWRGAGPVPWSHEPNRGFLRALAVLGHAAGAIREEEEAARCRTFLADCDPEAARVLGLA